MGQWLGGWLGEPLEPLKLQAQLGVFERRARFTPVVIRQGGNGLGSVIAALILAAAAVYAINVWSTTKKETSPAKNIEQGIERIKDAAGKAIESRY